MAASEPLEVRANYKGLGQADEIEIISAPKTTEMSIELMGHIAGRYGEISGPFITVGTKTPVTYKVTGWNPDTEALILENVS